MKITIRNSSQVTAGLVFVVIGIAAVILSSRYSLGTGRAMGPGYFPTALGYLLIVLGGAAALQGLRVKQFKPVETIQLVPLFFLIASVIAFGLLVERWGIAIAVAALVMLSCYNRLRTKPLEVLLIYIVLTSLITFLFVYVLKQNFKII